MEDKERVENTFNRLSNMMIADAIESDNWELFISLGLDNEPLQKIKAQVQESEGHRKRLAERFRNTEELFVKWTIDIENMPTELKLLFGVGDIPLDGIEVAEETKDGNIL